MSLYVYAFTDEPIRVSCAGLDDQPVTPVDAGGLFVLVSEAPRGSLRPQRRHLAAHQRVLADAAARGAVLPASFGLVASGEAALTRLVEAEGGTLSLELERVRGCVEMSVALRWDVPNVFDHLVAIDSELRSMRDALLRAGDAATHDMRVGIGRRVERVIAAHRREHGSAVVDAIEDVCREIIEDAPRDESALFSASCLVERERTRELEAAVEAVARRFDDSFAFGITGPFAPHHFVSVRIDPETVAA